MRCGLFATSLQGRPAAKKNLFSRHEKTWTPENILRVNLAGEHGATHIYRAQIAVASLFFRDMLPFLHETLNHEKRHCRLFHDMAAARSVRPCRAMTLWALGGGLLGLSSTLFGAHGVWICTAAVEATVYRHMRSQLTYLKPRDAELYALVATILREETGHLRYARSRAGVLTPPMRALRNAIAMATEFAVQRSF